MDSPDIAILTAGDEDIVCDWHKTVDCVWVPGELVTVQTILAPEGNVFMRSYQMFMKMIWKL